MVSVFVWRVEDVAGTGPYWSRSWDHRPITEAHSFDGVHVPPHVDYVPRPGCRALSCGAAVCGCNSAASLRAWFAGWWQRLERAGFRVAVYDVPAVWEGKRQCVFDNREAGPVRVLPVSEFLHDANPRRECNDESKGVE